MDVAIPRKIVLLPEVVTCFGWFVVVAEPPDPSAVVAGSAVVLVTPVM